MCAQSVHKAEKKREEKKTTNIHIIKLKHLEVDFVHWQRSHSSGAFQNLHYLLLSSPNISCQSPHCTTHCLKERKPHVQTIQMLTRLEKKTTLSHFIPQTDFLNFLNANLLKGLAQQNFFMLLSICLKMCLCKHFLAFLFARSWTAWSKKKKSFILKVIKQCQGYETVMNEFCFATGSLCVTTRLMVLHLQFFSVRALEL